MRQIGPKKNLRAVGFLRAMNRYRGLVVVVSILIVLVIWEALVLIFRFPPFILPSPEQVFVRFWMAMLDGTLLRNTGYTLLEVLLGLASGTLLATVLGYLLARSRMVERMLSPLLVSSQAIPTVAIAPLLVIWFGPGIFSKILICALIVFFPVLVNTIVGLRAVPESLKDVMKSMRATPVQMLRYLEIPAALPVFLGGLRIGATLSVIGAVVGEFVGANHGLGFLVNVARGQYDTALVFAAVFTLVILAVALYGMIVLLETIFLKWQKKPSED